MSKHLLKRVSILLLVALLIIVNSTILKETAYGFDPSQDYVYLANSGSKPIIGTYAIYILSDPWSEDKDEVGVIYVGGDSFGVAVNSDGTRVYVTHPDIDTVSVIDPTTAPPSVSSISVGDSPYGVAVNHSGKRVYVTNQFSDTVSVIDTSTSTVVASITVGDRPQGIAVNNDGTRVYVTNYYSNTVSVIDTSTNSVIATISVGKNPYAIDVNPFRSSVYVVNRGSNTLSVINQFTNTVVASIPVGDYPQDVAVYVDGTRAYVTNYSSNTISVIDTSTNNVIDTRTTSPRPRSIAVSRKGYIYITYAGKTFVEIFQSRDLSNFLHRVINIFSSPGCFGQCVVPAELPDNRIISISSNGGGTITSTPTRISCGSNCSEYFTVGSSVTLSATPDSGWTFVAWSGACSGAQTTCQLTMDSDKAVTATFMELDTTGPTGTITINGGAAYTNNHTVTLTLSAMDPSGVSQMQFHSPGYIWSDPEPYGTTKSWTLKYDNSQTVSAKFKDGAGNWSDPVSATINYDWWIPTGSVRINGGGNVVYTSNPDVTLTLSTALDSSGISQMQFSNDNVTWSDPETYGETKYWRLLLGEGLKTVYVKVKDGAGNWSDPFSATAYLDTTAPVTTITDKPASITNATTANFTFSANEVSTFQCQLDSGGFSACTSPKTYTGLTEGDHTFTVKATDTAGNVEATSPNYSWSIDIAPTLSIGTPSATLTKSGPVTYVVTYTGADAVTLANPDVTLTKTGTANGTVVVNGSGNTVRTVTISGITGSGTLGISIAAGTASDNTGNIATATGPSTTFTVDNTVPVTTIGDKPAVITNATTANFNFTANEAATFQCQIDSGVFSTCVSPQTYTGLTEGSHFFSVKATDTAGNTELLPPSHTWTIDITKPVVGVSYSGGLYTNAGTITLTLSGTDSSGLAGMMFSWDGGASWGTEETYGTTKTWNLGSSDGLKTVYVKFKDTGGNWSDPYRYDLTLDTVPPVLDVTSHGPCTNNPALTISGTATDTLSGLKNVTVNGTAVTVQSGSFSQGLTLANGANTIVIAATDNADNVTTVNQVITFDQTAPVLTVSAPAEMGDIDLFTGAAMIDVKGTVNESDTVTIRVNSDTPVVVPVLENAFIYPVTLETGTNVIEVTAVDCAGNTATVQRTVIYDKDKPVLSVTAPAADMATNQSGLTIRGSVSDQTAITLTIKVNSDSYPVTVSNGIFEKVVTFTEEKTYQIEVTATDAGGNTTTITRNVVYDKTQPVFTVNPVTTPTNQDSQTLYGTREAKAIITATCNTAATVETVSYPSETTWSIVLTNLVDGANTITLTAIDAAGNTTVTTTSIFLDRTIEIAVISGTPNSPTKTTSATMNIGGSGITAYKYKLDTSAYSAETPVATPITLNSLTEGTHTLSVIGKDAAGNWQSEANATTTTWVVDLTPPIITATPAGNVYQTPQTVLLTSSEAATTYYTVDDNEPTITSQVYGGLIPIRKTTNLKFFARDGAGNMGSTRTETYTLSIPLTVVMSGWGGGAVTVDGTSLSWNERTASAIYNRVTDVTLRAIPDGNSSFVSWSGACSGDSLTCTVAMDQVRTVTAAFADITLPTGSVSYTGGIYATGSTVTLNLSASDVTGISAMRFSSDGTVWGSEQVFGQTWIWNLGSGDGQKKVYVQFRDNAGNWSQSYSYTLTLDTTTPVLNLSTLSDGAYTDNSTLNISGTINDVTSGVKTLTINGTAVTVQGGSFNHTITLKSGANVITTIATDNAGNAATDTRTIVYDIAPTPKGDINGNSVVDIADAVMALQIVSRVTPAQPINKNADVDGDAKIGLQEVIYILQKVAEMR